MAAWFALVEGRFEAVVDLVAGRNHIDDDSERSVLDGPFLPQPAWKAVFVAATSKSTYPMGCSCSSFPSATNIGEMPR